MLWSPFARYPSSQQKYRSFCNKNDWAKCALFDGSHEVYSILRDESFKSLSKRRYYLWSMIGRRRALQDVYADDPEMNVFRAYYAYFRFIGWALAAPAAKILARCKPDELLKVCKAVTMYCKVKAHYTKWWKYFVDLETLVGYPKISDRIGSIDEVTSWLSGNVRMQVTPDVIRNEYNIIMGAKVRPQQFDDFNTWVLKRYTWFNSGSTSYSKMSVDGLERRTKTGAALSMTDAELMKVIEWETIMREGLRIFVKPDEKGPKLRYIISAPLGLYIRMLYVLKLIEATYPALKSRFAQYLDRTDFIASVGQHIDSVQIPIDTSSFDYNISDVWWQVFWAKLRDDGIAIEQVSLFEQLIGKLPWTFENTKGTWEKGVPSGLVFTAFIDTLINLAAMRIAARMFPDLEPLFAQGDDGYLVSPKDVDLVRLSDLYESLFGMIVNDKKNWQAFGVGEFLKMILKSNSIEQYPARIFSSLFWIYPDFRDNDKWNKLFETAALWKELLDRCDMTEFTPAIMHDLHIGVRYNITKGNLKRWLHAPQALGGFGLSPIQPCVVKVKRKWRLKNIGGVLFNRYFESTTQFDTSTKVHVYPVDLTRWFGPVHFESLSSLSPRPNSLEEFLEIQRWKSGLDSTFEPLNHVNPAILEDFQMPRLPLHSELAVAFRLKEYRGLVPMTTSKYKRAALQLGFDNFLRFTRSPFLPFLLK